MVGDFWCWLHTVQCHRTFCPCTSHCTSCSQQALPVENKYKSQTLSFSFSISVDVCNQPKCCFFNFWLSGYILPDCTSKFRLNESQNSLGWKGLFKVIGLTIHRKREPRWAYQAPCKVYTHKIKIAHKSVKLFIKYQFKVLEYQQKVSSKVYK